MTSQITVKIFPDEAAAVNSFCIINTISGVAIFSQERRCVYIILTKKWGIRN